MREPIPYAVIEALCEAAGLHPDIVQRIVLAPGMATFTVYDLDPEGKKIVQGEGDYRVVQTSLVTVPISRP